MEDDYVSADHASALLGVARSTLYAYVGRKGIRTRPVPGTRRHLYRRADVEKIKAGAVRDDGAPVAITTRIAEVRDGELLYRGVSAADLAESATFEEVAARLWNVEPAIFARPPPHASKLFGRLDDLLADEAGVDRALAHFPFLEQANPRAYDLTPQGMAVTGVDIVRWLTAIILGRRQADEAPVHRQFEEALKLEPARSDLLRRIMILAADHGLTDSTRAVRAVARAGVTPWRSVSAGLTLAVGRQSKFGQNESLRRFVDEILAAQDAEAVTTRQLREGQDPPGFGNPAYVAGDPRAAAVLAYCERALGDHEGYRKLRRAVELVYEVRGVRPNFALVSTFAEALTGLRSRREFIGLSSSEAPYLIGRSAGWVAHCIEQTEGGSRDAGAGG